jgi:hypothetical protein
MEKIKLLTKDGSFVGYAGLLPFTDRVKIVIWGQRVFEFDTLTENDIPTYREVFVSTVFTWMGVNAF